MVGYEAEVNEKAKAMDDSLLSSQAVSGTLETTEQALHRLEEVLDLLDAPIMLLDTGSLNELFQPKPFRTPLIGFPAVHRGASAALQQVHAVHARRRFARPTLDPD